MKKSDPPRRPREGAGTGKREVLQGTLLLVESDAGSRRRISESFETQGYRVLTAGNGEEALALSVSYKGPIHLLVTDVMMPVMNGKELSERLCAMRAEIQVLFVSSYAKEEVLPGNGCSDREHWLSKPHSAARLFARVRSILAGRRGPRPASGS